LTNATAIGSGGAAGFNNTSGNGALYGSGSAQATASGTSGTATATSSSAGSVISGLTSSASGPTAGNATATQSWAAVSQPTPSPSLLAGLQAGAFDTGLPSTSDSLSALSAAPRVHHDFNIAGEGTGSLSAVLGLVALGGGSDGDDIQHAWTASTTMTLSVTTLSQQHLILGLLNPQSTGNGFDSLTFTVTKNTTTVLQSVTFTSLANANAYFTNDAIDLGSVTGLTSIKFQLSETTTAPTDSYDASLIFGDATVNAGPVPTPEPATTALAGFLATGLLKRRRRGRGNRGGRR
jgi:hypothetical protein